MENIELINNIKTKINRLIYNNATFITYKANGNIYVLGELTFKEIWDEENDPSNYVILFKDLPIKELNNDSSKELFNYIVDKYKVKHQEDFKKYLNEF